MKESRVLIPSDQTGYAELPKKNALPGDSKKKIWRESGTKGRGQNLGDILVESPP